MRKRHSSVLVWAIFMICAELRPPIIVAAVVGLLIAFVQANAQAVEGLVAVGTDEALRQHQVRQIGFANLGEDLVGVHWFLLPVCSSIDD